jgi:hypothetical protein
MRIFFKALLVVVILFVAYLCYDSIITPIRFERQKEVRDKAVKKKLIDIQTAQNEFNNINQRYTGSFDTLITFIKTARMPVIMKEGELTDAQLEKGLTEEIAVRLQPKQAVQYGIEDYDAFKAAFRRDTSYVSILEFAFGKEYPIDSIRYVPFTDGGQFEMQAVMYPATPEISIPLFEAKVPYEVYLKGMDEQEITNLIDKSLTNGKYPGLKVGNIISPNNNAGNWE